MGGSTKTTTRVPKWQEDAAKAGLARAEGIANIGYAPYYGPDVAALTPQQIAAMTGTNQAASAFGMATTDPMAGLPPAQDFNGVQGYSSGGMYDQAVAELQRRNPDIYNAIMAQFNPAGVTAPATSVPTPVQEERDRSNRSSRNSRSSAPAGPSSSSGGFSSFRDMFDGGGAGRSGGSFEGGPLSGILNRTGVTPRGSSAGPVVSPTRPAPRPVVSPPRPAVSPTRPQPRPTPPRPKTAPIGKGR